MFLNTIHRGILTARRNGSDSFTMNDLDRKVIDIPRLKNHLSIKIIRGSKSELSWFVVQKHGKECRQFILKFFKLA